MYCNLGKFFFTSPSILSQYDLQKAYDDALHKQDEKIAVADKLYSLVSIIKFQSLQFLMC